MVERGFQRRGRDGSVVRVDASALLKGRGRDSVHVLLGRFSYFGGRSRDDRIRFRRLRESEIRLRRLRRGLRDPDEGGDVRGPRAESLLRGFDIRQGGARRSRGTPRARPGAGGGDPPLLRRRGEAARAGEARLGEARGDCARGRGPEGSSAERYDPTNDSASRRSARRERRSSPQRGYFPPPRRFPRARRRVLKVPPERAGRVRLRELRREAGGARARARSPLDARTRTRKRRSTRGRMPRGWPPARRASRRAARARPHLVAQVGGAEVRLRGRDGRHPSQPFGERVVPPRPELSSLRPRGFRPRPP